MTKQHKASKQTKVSSFVPNWRQQTNSLSEHVCLSLGCIFSLSPRCNRCNTNSQHATHKLTRLTLYSSTTKPLKTLQTTWCTDMQTDDMPTCNPLKPCHSALEAGVSPNICFPVVLPFLSLLKDSSSLSLSTCDVFFLFFSQMTTV